MVPDGCKWCPDCERILPLSEFVRTVRNQSGCHAYCKPGHNTRGKVSRDKVGGSRTYHLSKRYGITAEEADLLLASQDGVCAICRSAPAAHVDHDHTTGAVRALLCFTCNGGLGQFRDDPRLLHAAAHYVSLHTARQKVLAGMDAAGSAREGSTRPGEPPVGSGRRPGNRPRGLGGRARRHVAAREADG